MESVDRVRIENLERAVASLADALQETIQLNGMGSTHWRENTLQEKVRAAKALLDRSTIILTDESARGAQSQP